MCGICGFVTLKRPACEARTRIHAMAGSLSHRGPDGSGIWISANKDAAVANTRLAIIDIEQGQQPMHSHCGRFVIVYNGELYNFADLRHELQSLGKVFRTHSDTEVVVEAFAHWGPACFSRFRGMYGIAIFDRENHELFLARDRTGIKPLYYYEGQDEFWFGSELKAILSANDVPRKIDYRAFADFLILGYPLAPKTFFKDIYELEPGTWVRINKTGIVRQTYWTWHDYGACNMSAIEAQQYAEHAIIVSLRDHLVSDVPIGAFLSGGIDSSLLVALLVKALGRNVDTFTVAFSESEYDESQYATIVANHLGVRHQTIVLDPAASDISLVDRIIAQFDQPFGDSSAIPTYMICKEIKRSVKVALGGDGGDEMFGGYPRFAHADLAKYAGKLGDAFLVASNIAGRSLGSVMPSFSRQWSRFCRAATSRDEARLLSLSCYTFPDQLDGILKPAAILQLDNYIPVLLKGCHDPGGREFVEATVHRALPGDYLRKIDVMSGAHGLEVRVPFLGEPVLECAARIPTALKYTYRNNKVILRQLVKKYLPDTIADKPKRGFGIPLDTWLGSNGRSELCAMLSSPRAKIRELIRNDYLEPLLQSFRDQKWQLRTRSRFNTYQQVYFLWCLENWLTRWNPAL